MDPLGALIQALQRVGLPFSVLRRPGKRGMVIKVDTSNPPPGANVFSYRVKVSSVKA